jgi:hypothetical protein
MIKTSAVPLAFEFKHQIVSAQLDAPAEFRQRFARESRKLPVGSLLRWQAGIGVTGPVTVRSGSGYTNFVVDGDLIRGQTRYFTRDYSGPEGWGTRSTYSKDRLQVLLGIAEKAGASPLMLSVTYVAASPVRQGPELVRRKLIEGLGLMSLYSRGGTTPADVSLRLGYPFTSDCYLNAQIAWYQTRSFTIVPRAGEITSLRDWEGHQDEEGIEIRLDINNKLGLNSGRVDWSPTTIVEAISSAEAGLPAEFARITQALNTAMGADS